MIWLALSLGVVLAIVCLWWFAMARRKDAPPKPGRPYREWKD